MDGPSQYHVDRPLPSINLQLDFDYNNSSNRPVPDIQLQSPAVRTGCRTNDLLQTNVRPNTSDNALALPAASRGVPLGTFWTTAMKL